MALFPVFLKLKDIPCLVVGGGVVAGRKAKSLLEAEARLTIISPTVTRDLERMIAKGAIVHKSREYRNGDVNGYFVVIASTNSRGTNRQIFKEAVHRKILINSVDDPENSSFFVPAVVRRGDLQIAVSTSGKVPYFSKKLRQFLEEKIYNEIDADLVELCELRNEILGRQPVSKEEKEQKFSAILYPKIARIFKKIDAG